MELYQLSHEKNPDWLGYLLGMSHPTQLYRDYVINHYKDPY